MRVSVILGHPQKKSFNHAIADMVVSTLNENGYGVNFHDLYEENFDPVLPLSEISKEAKTDSIIANHCNEISVAEGIIIVHPNWWGQPPSILKGWVDRVIRAGVAYHFLEGDNGEGVPVGLLKAKATIVFNTSNTPMEREIKVFGDPLETIWKNCVFGLCGVNNFYRKMYEVVITSSEEQRQAWLADVKNTVNIYFPKIVE